MAVDTGKVVFGSRKTQKLALAGKGKLIIVADNCPKKIKENLDYYAEISNINMIEYEGDGKVLGETNGKPFNIACMVIMEPGDSKILDICKTE